MDCRRCWTGSIVLIGQLLRLVPGPISDMLMISVSLETGHATAENMAPPKHFIQGHSHGILVVSDLVPDWADLSILVDA